MIDMIELKHGDCIKLMEEIPNRSIDMILCDLPYGSTSCAWDITIPFEPLWEQYNKIIKCNGVVVLFGSQPFTSKLLCSNINNFREELIWLKNRSASGMQAKQKHMKIHENILVFAPNPKYTYNPQKWLVSEKEFLTQRKTFRENEYIRNNIYAPATRTRNPDDGSRNPISILSARVPFTPQKSKQYCDDIELRLHPTQKPIALLEYLIKTYTNEGDTVLDNCMGSGSTGVACVNTNRNFIGMEIVQHYFEISKERILSVSKMQHNEESSYECTTATCACSV